MATLAGRQLSVEEAGVAAMRDRLAHRGPDGSGLWCGGNVTLGHRRLAVVGLGDDGHQPLVSGCGRHVLVYNGELYNDHAVRGLLEPDCGQAAGRRGASDTPTVLAALVAWGATGLWHLRGMYAIAWYDRIRHVLTLARDPLGIKPLVWWRGHVPGAGEEIVFASEVTAVLAHPHVRARPDLTTVSSYLTTIRTTLGSRTMFEGVRTVLPGEWIEFELGDRRIVERHGRIARTDERDGAANVQGLRKGGTGAIEAVREVVQESVRVHLRSDVPWCGLLSGGLDSTIVCAEAKRHVAALRTYAAGARNDPESDGDGGMVLRPGARAELSEDFAFARLAAQRLNTQHDECVVTREMFTQRWAWMVQHLGLPLSTPNEVAIHAVAARLRSAGNVVALSGEGADELFGGYDRLLGAAAAWVEAGGAIEDGGVYGLDSAAWVPRAAKTGLLRPVFWQAVEEDAGLVETYRDEFTECVAEAGAAGWRGSEGLMQAFLRMQRRVNLVGLLGRLDGATMLAGVEGRTPFADLEVMRLAEGLAMELKFVAGSQHATRGDPPLANASRDGTGVPRTKTALRRAFEGVLPREIVERPKASFPLPFESWMVGATELLTGSGLVESLFEQGAVGMVRAEPGRVWGLAWPMLNLAIWGKRWGW